MKKEDRKKRLRRNGKQLKPGFVPWKSKSSKAKSRKKKRSVGSKLHNARLRRRRPD